MERQHLEDLPNFSGAWPKTSHLVDLLPDLIKQTSGIYSYRPSGNMASLEQHGNTETRGNVARIVDRLSKDISLLHNPAFKPGEVHLRKGGNPGANGAKIAVVRFSYLAQQEDELDLMEGDELEVLEDVEDGWARGQIIGLQEGQNNSSALGKIGLFPTNFVSFASEIPLNNPSVFSTSITSSLSKVVEEKAQAENHSNGDMESTKKESAGDGQHLTTLPLNLHKSVGEGSRRVQQSGLQLSSAVDSAINSPPSVMASTGPTLNHPPAIPPPPSQANLLAYQSNRIKEMAKVIYKYEAANPDELSLPEGALITVIKKKCEDDGWYEGEYNGKRGLFPENFVKLIETSSSIDKASPVSVGGHQPPPTLPAKPSKTLHSQPIPVASARDSTVSQTVDPCLSAATRPEERKSMIAGLQSKLFPTGKLPPQRPPPAHNSEGSKEKSPSSSVEDLSKLSSLTKTRPKQVNKRPPSMNFRASKQPTGNAVFDDSPVLGGGSFNSSISSTGSAVRPDSFFSTSSLSKELAQPKTSSAKQTAKQALLIPPDASVAVSAAPRFSAINTSSTSSEWISRQEFEKYRSEVNLKLEEMGEKLAELSALKK